MIMAKFNKGGDGSIRMVLKGHARTAPKGEDLICAAATTLAYTAAQAVTFFHQQGKLKRPPKIDIREGSATVIATPTQEGYPQVLHAFWVVQCGIHLLVCNYPEQIRLEHLTL